jgi:hypothetical protein
LSSKGNPYLHSDSNMAVGWASSSTQEGRNFASVTKGTPDFSISATRDDLGKENATPSRSNGAVTFGGVFTQAAARDADPPSSALPNKAEQLTLLHVSQTMADAFEGGFNTDSANLSQGLSLQTKTHSHMVDLDTFATGGGVEGGEVTMSPASARSSSSSDTSKNSTKSGDDDDVNHFLSTVRTGNEEPAETAANVPFQKILLGAPLANAAVLQSLLAANNDMGLVANSDAGLETAAAGIIPSSGAGVAIVNLVPTLRATTDATTVAVTAAANKTEVPEFEVPGQIERTEGSALAASTTTTTAAVQPTVTDRGTAVAGSNAADTTSATKATIPMAGDAKGAGARSQRRAPSPEGLLAKLDRSQFTWRQFASELTKEVRFNPAELNTYFKGKENDDRHGEPHGSDQWSYTRTRGGEKVATLAELARNASHVMHQSQQALFGDSVSTSHPVVSSTAAAVPPFEVPPSGGSIAEFRHDLGDGRRLDTSLHPVSSTSSGSALGSSLHSSAFAFTVPSRGPSSFSSSAATTATSASSTHKRALAALESPPERRCTSTWPKFDNQYDQDLFETMDTVVSSDFNMEKNGAQPYKSDAYANAASFGHAASKEGQEHPQDLRRAPQQRLRKTQQKEYSFVIPSFLPSFLHLLPSFLPSSSIVISLFLPSFLSSCFFLPSFLPSSTPFLPSFPI